ncbi:MAG: hypothetical protein KDB90_04675 [Planctomycetes bacterium]|nr:hypothetical protein [Planctomycetota bacterium]
MSDKPKVVIRNGVSMVEGWSERIEEAQKQPTISIGGHLFDRVRYGEESEDWGADEHPCHGCRVVKGEVHVMGCDGERCPACGGQIIWCDCPFDDDEWFENVGAGVLARVGHR